MYKIENALSQNTLLKYEKEVREKSGLLCWGASDLLWDSSLVIGVSGTCLSALVSDSLKVDILNDIQLKLPKFDNITMQHYIWTRGSGISEHNDYVYKFGATIYMNESWDINNGGIFMWKNKANDYDTIIPSYNTMVVNDEAEYHLVTPVSLTSPELRLTIQIWGK